MFARAATAVRRISTGPLRDAVIVSAVRTPIGCISGSLASVTAPQLGSIAIKGALERAGAKPEHVEEVLMGNVVSGGMGQAPARQAALGAGLPESVTCTTINKVCASGMKAVMLAAQSVALGHSRLTVAGGMESMTHVPYYLPGVRAGLRYGHTQMLDGVIKDGLWDVYNDVHMGVCAEKTAADMGIGRKEQDEYAIMSYKRSAAATAAGKFASEIIPVPVKGKKGESVMTTVDEQIARVNFDKLPTLRPVFKKDGTITAANASPLNDGASALIITTRERAAELGMKPIARIRSFADAEQAPIDFPTAPAKAVPLALKRAGVTAKDIDYHEINEAFAVVVLANAKILNLDLARVNVFGGGVSLGHPIGSSGARIIATLINVLQQHDGTLGVASICNGGGGGSAVVIERL